MIFEESQESKNLMKLNNDYMDVYYSSSYQRYINRKVRKLDIKTIINELKTGYFMNRIKSMFSVETKDNVDNCKEELRVVDSSDRIAIYTVIIGGYDTLKQPLYISSQCDYFVISDQDIDVTNTCWKLININSFNIDKTYSNTKKARYVKTHPDVFFPDYKYSIFIDGNFLVVADLVPLVMRLGSGSFAAHLHPKNNCIYQEGKDIIALGKSSELDVKKQLVAYKNEGFPKHFGLCETNILVREHNEFHCKNIDAAWWNEMQKYTLRDQLSLTYVVWKYEKEFEWIRCLGNNPRKNPRLRYLSHK